MAIVDLVIRARRAVTGEAAQSEGPLTVAVDSGKTVAVDPSEDSPLQGRETLELGPDVVLMPGLVDPHVHICEPGNTEWEGFATATRAAAAGGITTLVDMPLDSVPTTVTIPALELKRQAAAGQCRVDVGFWGGVIPGTVGQVRLLAQAGVLGFKCYLADSGSPDFPPVTVDELTATLRVLADLGLPLLVHAESAQAIAAIQDSSGPSYADFLATRPRGVENLAVAQVIEAARATGGRAHIVHLSSSDAIPMIASAQRDGVRITAETCAHYLAISAEEIEPGATAFKCSPPIREKANQDLLWQALAAGTIGFVASDHSPCTEEMKDLASGDFGTAWGGISSLELGLPVVWTEARRRGIPLGQVAEWMASAPARFAGLPAKGRIAAGCDADFCVFAPDETFTVDPDKLRQRHHITPYAGLTLDGVVRDTLLGGRTVEDAGAPRGRLLRNTALRENTYQTGKAKS